MVIERAKGRGSGFKGGLSNPRPSRANERGFALLMVFALGVVLAIFAYLAQPDWIQQRRRSREAELIYRGEHIARAIREFQQENSRWPTSLEELMKEGPKQHRYLRQLYAEPLNPSGEWDLIPAGDPSTLPQNPQAGSPFAEPGDAAPALSGGASDLLFGESVPAPTEGPAPSASGDRQPQRPFVIGRCRAAQPGGPAGALPIPPPGGIVPSAGQPGAIGNPIGRPIGTAIGKPLGEAGPGTQIVGVASLVDEEGLREYRKKKRYCEWLFLANPPAVPGQPMVPAGGINPPANNPPNPPGASPRL